MKRRPIDKLVADIETEARHAEKQASRGDLRTGADASAPAAIEASAVTFGESDSGERTRPEPRRVDGPIVGYRTWDLHYWCYPMRLMGYRDTPWRRAMPPAKCLPLRYGSYFSVAGYSMTHVPPTCTAAPGWDCACGYNALTEVPGLSLWKPPLQTAAGGPSEEPVPATMVGIVAGWGKVILHEDGWRSEHARVLALVGLDRTIVDPTLLDAAELYLNRAEIIAKKLDVPVLSPDQARAYVSEFTEAQNA